MSQKQESIQAAISLLLVGGAIVFIFWLLGKLSSPDPDPTVEKTPVSPPPPTVSQPSPSLKPEISLGEEILITKDQTPEKEAGVKAFESGDFASAINEFEQSLKKQPNDPETLIYLNNAKIAIDNWKYLKVAVVTGIGNNLNQSQEILRGVAQAQYEVNNSKELINGLPLQIEIVNENGEENTAQELARDLVKDDKILAVIGHSTPQTSFAAAQTYNSEGVVMITPSFAPTQLSQIGQYIFRGAPDSSIAANKLAEYIVKEADLTKITICIDSLNPQLKATQDEYTKAISDAGGQVTSTVCDFNALGDPKTVMSRARSAGAQGLLIMPNPNNLKPAIDLAEANKEGGERLKLFTHGGLYTYNTLRDGKENLNGMILSAFWHPEADPNNPFPKNANKLWGGPVNARTASAYDTVQAIIEGLKEAARKQGNTREELKKELSKPDFSASGATKPIKFSSQARKGEPLLIKIAPGQRSGTGYDFVLLK